MLKRIVGLALIAAAGLLVWLWLRRRQDDFATMNTQFAPPDLSLQRPSPPPAIAVSAAPSENKAQAIQSQLLPGDEAPPQAEAAPAELPPTPEELDMLFEDSVAPQPPAAPATDELPPVVALPLGATTEDGADAAPPAVEEPAQPAGDTATEATSDANEDDLDNVTGYCVRCKTKREIVDAHEETTESGRRAARGTCPVCGANMFTFLKEEPEDDQNSG